jgi:hypothetical protein
MVNDRDSPGGEYARDLDQVRRLVDWCDVDKDIKRPNRVDGAAGDPGQIATSGKDVLDVAGSLEELLAELEWPLAYVHQNQAWRACREDL